jgi:hypothetical protein
MPALGRPAAGYFVAMALIVYLSDVGPMASRWFPLIARSPRANEAPVDLAAAAALPGRLVLPAHRLDR